MIQTARITYTDQGQSFEGFSAWDDQSHDFRPGILVTHAFGGLSDFEKEKARELAKLGYVGFALDLYGQGKRATNNDEARELMNKLDSDRELLLKRMKLGLSTLKRQDLVDADNIAAIGYCFGGKCVLDLARSGESIKGVVSFHGVYDQPPIHTNNKINCSVLVIDGWEDPLSKPEQKVALANDLTVREAEWQILTFGHTGHSFTNPKAQRRDLGMFFQEQSNRRAWNTMKQFFDELFQPKT